MRSAGNFVPLFLAALLVSALFGVVGLANSAPPFSQPAGDAIKEQPVTSQMPFSKSSRYFDPALQDASGRSGVLVAMDASSPVTEVAKYLIGARALPEFGDVRILRGLIDSNRISDLQSLPSVLAILKDRPIGFDAPNKRPVDSRLPPNFREMRLPQPATIERESLTGGPEVSMRDVVNFTGARRAWTQLGVDGTGVTIAVVDTGVDHGTFNLGNGATARDAAGTPTSFDPDGSTFAWTTINATSYRNNTGTWVTTRGTDPLIYIFDLFGLFGPYGAKAIHWSTLWRGASFFSDMNITGLPPSISRTYHFGVLFEWNFNVDLFPVLVVDTKTAGVYDTAYLDLSFDWWLNGFMSSPDFSFADEPALVPAGGNLVAARDMNRDGYPDISAGSLAQELDIWGVNPSAADRYKILKPIDPKGNYITMVYDWNGHGTSVAASAAGRESSHPLAGPGTGPGAKIMAVPIFAWFDVVEGWLWASGFDLAGTTISAFVSNYGVTYGQWTYTGNHKADIISNSWGFSAWLIPAYSYQWPWYDVLTVIEDALMTPGYADPSYPGTVFVHAAGNGASGYGTVTGPAFSNLAITVGASTNLNHTSLPFGGFHNDVMSWSARGPTALGVPKPDLLQVGAFAWTAGPVWSGRGNGRNAFTLFGGTSQATPVTSGSAAVVIEAYQKAHGSRPSPFAVKSILKSTATDLGYDAFVEGAGQVNVYNAAADALGKAGVLVTSPATWDAVRPLLAAPWAEESVFFGRQVGIAPPAGPIADTSWFAGSVHPGSSKSAAFTIAANATVSGSISPVWHTRLGSVITITGTTGTLGPGWLEGYGAIRPLSPLAIPAGADLMLVRASMPYSFLDTNGDYTWDNRSRIVVGDWVDANGNGIVEPAEVKVFNYGYNTGTTVEARVGLPNGRFAGSPVLWFSQVPAAGGRFVPMPFTIQVEFYGRVAWPWIAGPATFVASVGAPATWTGTVSVPASANPGVYEGQILVTPAGGNTTAVPVSVVVPRIINASSLSGSLTSSGSTQLYDPSSVNGYFDWRWRYEQGDWKLWFVDVTDPTTVALRVDLAWTDPKTDIDLWSITPNGIPGDSTFSPTLGTDGGNNRRFIWSTRTGTTADWVVASTASSLDQSAVGLYAFALHNVLLGGSTMPESVTGSVGAAKLSPRGPITVVTQPGKTYSVPFTLSTGYALTNAFTFAVLPSTSAFPAIATPEFTSLVPAGGRLPFWVNITIPTGTVDGTYANYVVVAADDLPQVAVRINVVVDSTAPGVSILAPGTNAYVRGSTTLQAAVADANNVSSVSFTAGSASGPMSRDPVTGVWTANWDTTVTPDGTATISVTATDAAGNVAAGSRTVVVDNTAPAASFTSPNANAWVRGTVNVSFSVSDANLATVTLSYGGTGVDVAGRSSYFVDTRVLADGSQTVSLKAVDRAGNTKIVSLAVRVDNTPPTAVLLGPQDGAFVRGGVTVSFVATDTNLGSATLTIGAQSFDVKGKTSQTIDTTAVADGTHTLTLVIADLAGNVATSSRSLTIDNTAPAVAISAPSANANLRDTTTISWTATDANLDTIWLAIDGKARDVSGTTSFSWDTRTVGDGSHTISVRATDKAGNEKVVTMSVTTDNVAVATGNAMTTGLYYGLTIGLVVAAAVGFVAGFLIARRRRPKEPASPPTVPEAPQIPGPPPPEKI